MGGAIKATGTALSLVTLNVSGCVFDSNRVNTATSYGGAIYLNDVIANITNNYFVNNKSLGANTNGGGGAICVEVGSAISDIYINQNLFDCRALTGSRVSSCGSRFQICETSHRDREY